MTFSLWATHVWSRHFRDQTATLEFKVKTHLFSIILFHRYWSCCYCCDSRITINNSMVVFCQIIPPYLGIKNITQLRLNFYYLIIHCVFVSFDGWLIWFYHLTWKCSTYLCENEFKFVKLVWRYRVLSSQRKFNEVLMLQPQLTEYKIVHKTQLIRFKMLIADYAICLILLWDICFTIKGQLYGEDFLLYWKMCRKTLSHELEKAHNLDTMSYGIFGATNLCIFLALSLSVCFFYRIILQLRLRRKLRIQAITRTF